MDKLNKTVFENIKENPQFFLDVIFKEGDAQKFVQFEDELGKNYIASYPLDICRDHKDIVKKATEIFKQRGKEVSVKGAGFLSKIEDEIKLWGKSMTLKLSFKGSEVSQVLLEAFPGLQIEID